MMTRSKSDYTHPLTDSHRRELRRFAAVMSAFTALIYFLIGFRVIAVVQPPTDQSWGVFAGIAYAVGVLLLLRVDRRVVWMLGIVLQVGVIFTYLSLATERSPAFEVWGVVLRMSQFLILIALAYLAARAERPAAYNGKHL
jgi:uncharacterized membrane protein